jgi:hypothetical protein
MKWVFQFDCVLRVSNYYLPQRDELILFTGVRLVLLFPYFGQRISSGSTGFLLLKPFLGGKMRFVVIETGQAMSTPQTPTTNNRCFLEMISPVPIVLCDCPGRLNGSHTS